MYHEIYRPEDRPHLEGLTNRAYNTEVSTFQKQMTWLSANNFKTLTIGELFSKDLLADGKRRICLTFDDGWAGNYRNAYPILKEKGFKATFFVATGLIGKPFYMTWDHIREMHTSCRRELFIQSGSEGFSKSSSTQGYGMVLTCTSIVRTISGYPISCTNERTG